MKTIGQILHHKNFPLYILDSNEDELYSELLSGYWWKSEYNDKGTLIYSENSNGYIITDHENNWRNNTS